MTAQAPGKTHPAEKTDAVQPEPQARVRPKLSLHYGAKAAEERK